VPSPSTLKLAIVAGAIVSHKSSEAGVKVFEEIKTSRVFYQLPHHISSFRVFMKRLKAKRPPEKGFDSTFAIREYCLYDAPLNVFVELVSEDSDILSAMSNMRNLGTSDSFCHCEEDPRIVYELPSARIARPKIETSGSGDFVMVNLTDFSAHVTFDDINRYGPGKGPKFGDQLKLIQYLLPLRVVRKGRSFVHYECTE